MGDGGVSHKHQHRQHFVDDTTAFKQTPAIGGMTVHTEATSSTTTTVTTFLVNKKFIVESQHVKRLSMHKQQGEAFEDDYSLNNAS